MIVNGELVHNFFTYNQDAYNIKIEKLVHLKDGGYRGVQLKVTRRSHRPIIGWEVKAKLLDGGEGEMLQGEMYLDVEINGETKKGIAVSTIYGDTIYWHIPDGHGGKIHRLRLTIMSEIVRNTNEEADKDMQKKNCSALLDDFASLRTNELTSDVTIVCDEGKFPAHKLILSARSQVFAAMFSHKDTTEDHHQQVLIKDFDKLTMDLFLTFLYNATLPEDLSFESFAELLKAADKYQVPSLIENCAMNLGKKLSTDNYVLGAILGSVYRLPELKNEAIKAIVYSRATLSSMEGYQELRGYPDLLIEIVDYRATNQVFPNIL